MPRPPTFGNAVVRYFSFRLLPDPPAAGGRLTEYVTRNGLVIVALAALVLIGGAWYLFAGDKSSRAGAGGPNAEGAARAVAVVTAHPAKKEFAYEVEALGTLRANESVDITAKVADRVAAIHFNEGQQVRKGDVLIELDNTEARADLAAAEAAASDSRSQYKRSQELFQTQGAVGSAARAVAGDAARERSACRRRALASRRSRHHRAVQRARRAAQREPRRARQSGRGHHDARRSQRRQARFLRAGSVPLHAAAGPDGPGAAAPRTPDATFDGRVASVDTRVDPTTRSVAIRALIDNRDGRLRPGMFMTLKLVRSGRPGADAAGAGDRARERAALRVRRRRTARRTSARSRSAGAGPAKSKILHGLSADDGVIVDGTLNVRDGVPVRVQGSDALAADGRANGAS